VLSPPGSSRGRGALGAGMPSSIGASLGEQKRLQLEQLALESRLATEDIFDDQTLTGRLLIRYKLPEIDMSWSRSTVDEEHLEETFSDVSFATATFNPLDRRWKAVLKRGYGLVAVVIMFMNVLYSISSSFYNASEPLADRRQRTVFWVGLAMRLVTLIALAIFLFVLRYSTSRQHVLVATVATVWLCSLCAVLAIAQDEQLQSLRMNTTGIDVLRHQAEVPGLPMLIIMAVYVAGVPGLPFYMAMLCGWGQLPISLVMNASNGWDKLPWGVSLAREALFNVFGTFVAYSQIRQIKGNHLQRCLLEEAAQLEKGAAKRMQALTHNTVPKAVAERMIGVNDYSFAESYDSCTVLQSDIVGYTALMSKESGLWVLNFVSEIFEEFDSLCDEYAVDKIKTIGDAYVVCAGALTPDDPQRPHPQGTAPQRVVRMALRMQDVVLRKSKESGKEIGVRIGVHTGWTAGGNIGKVRPHFDIWGTGVTSTVKMEELGRKGFVHVSDATHRGLGDLFECTPRKLEEDLSEEDRAEALQTLGELGINKTYFVLSAKPPGSASLLGGGAMPSKPPPRPSSVQSYLGSKLSGLGKSSRLPIGLSLPKRMSSCHSPGRAQAATGPAGKGEIGTAHPLSQRMASLGEMEAVEDDDAGGAVGSGTSPFDIDEEAAAPPHDAARPEAKLLAGGGGGGRARGQSMGDFLRQSVKQMADASEEEGMLDQREARAAWSRLTKEEKAASLELAHRLMGRVLSTRAVVIAVVYPAFTLYDMVLWNALSSGPSIPLLITRAVFSLLTLILALVLTTRLSKMAQGTLRVANIALVTVPAAGAFFCILFAPDNSTQYMFALALFQIWTGYCTINLPTKEIAVWQILITIGLAVIESLATSFDSINGLVRPAWQPSAHAGSSVSSAFVYIYLAVAHALGIWYNRVTRHRVNRHAKQQVAGKRTLADSQRSLGECQKLLESVFPKAVFKRLQEESNKGESLTACEHFTHCTFLFAKIVGLNKLTSQESGVAPDKVVEILQMIFDRFDSLADLFLVQKVRKTVYESYMLAAGLPDKEILEGQEARAHAVVSLAGVMVAVMEIINRQLPKLGMPPSINLSLQIGIHSGSAIAGIMGHKRFQYDLCGDDVNVAARMMGGSAPRCINVSETTYELIKNDFDAIDRGERFVKGKGMMHQYFITGGASGKAANAFEAPPSVLKVASTLVTKQKLRQSVSDAASELVAASRQGSGGGSSQSGSAGGLAPIEHEGGEEVLSDDATSVSPNRLGAAVAASV